MGAEFMEKDGFGEEIASQIVVGAALSALIDDAKGYKKRACYSVLSSFLKSKNSGRVLILYGLRRTGKTTMIEQAI